METKTTVCLLILFTSALILNAQQTIEGYIYDFKTKQPLESVSIYFDGTTIGTTTNKQGYFNIEISNTIEASLVISYIGYDTKILPKNKLNSLSSIFLTEKTTNLDEVVITNDDWSRERKLRVFRNEFIGKTAEFNFCKILNEKDIRLKYNRHLNTLIAYADRPIIIKNKYLGYILYYDLIDFEVQYKKSIPDNLNIIHYVFFSGTCRFEELKAEPSKRHLRARRIAYNGSTLDFMRSLVNNTLKENLFEVFIKGKDSDIYFPATFKKAFKIVTNLNNFTVSLLDENVTTIRYNKFEQSTIEMKDGHDFFTVDTFGNYAPVNAITFGGEFGRKRISTMLPSNYGLKK